MVEDMGVLGWGLKKICLPVHAPDAPGLKGEVKFHFKNLTNYKRPYLAYAWKPKILLTQGVFCTYHHEDCHPHFTSANTHMTSPFAECQSHMSCQVVVDMEINVSV